MFPLEDLDETWTDYVSWVHLVTTRGARSYVKRSKSQRSQVENEVKIGHFRLKKKLGSHRSEFGAAILDLGPLNKYKKTQEIKI